MASDLFEFWRDAMAPVFGGPPIINTDHWKNEFFGRRLCRMHTQKIDIFIYHNNSENYSS